MAKNKQKKKYNPLKKADIVIQSRKHEYAQKGHALAMRDVVSALMWKLRLDGYSSKRLQKFIREFLEVYNDIDEFRLSPYTIVQQIELETGLNVQNFVNEVQGENRKRRAENKELIESMRNYDDRYKANYEVSK